MRLVTFNIRHGSDGPDSPVDHQALASAIVALDADVVGLQEVDRGRRRSGDVDQVALIAAATGGTAVFGRAVKFWDGEYGNALVVRGRRRDVEVVQLPHATLPWQERSEDRSALLAAVEVDGQTVTVLVTHLSTRWYEAVHQLRSATRTLTRRPGPHLLLGDLNLGPAIASPLLRRSGLTPVAGRRPTYPRVRPRTRIDHIATSGVRVGTVKVVDPGVSDHRALVVEATAR